METKMKKLAVIIGRFQVAQPHEGHRHLLETAKKQADDVLVLLGSTQALPSKRNPLPFAVREKMFRELFPDIFIKELPDQKTNLDWSANIDRIVAENFPEHIASLYGSRDSFIPCYEGSLPCVLIPPIAAAAGSQLRENFGISNYSNQDFRAGMIHVQAIRLPISYQAVDIAVIRYPENEVLMGMKKQDKGKYRFIGGFVDPTDESLEAAAVRELREEAGQIDGHEIVYLGSFRIPDFRYRGEEDQLMTAFFATYHLSGVPKAGDDIDEVAWIAIDDLESIIVPNHLPLAKRLIKFIHKNKKGEPS